MDLAVLIVGFVMGFMVCYFTLGPGKESAKAKKKQAKTNKRPPGRRPVWDQDEDDDE